MSEITETTTMINGTNDFLVVTWAGLANGDTGRAYALPTFADKTVHVYGVFGAGGSVTLKGSNSGVTYTSLHDFQGNNLTFTAEGIELLTENPRFIKPEVTAGDGTTSISIAIACRKA